jgi:hypothetical protein
MTPEQQKENERIQQKTDEVRDKKELPPVNLSDEDPFSVLERNKRPQQETT